MSSRAKNNGEKAKRIAVTIRLTGVLLSTLVWANAAQAQADGDDAARKPPEAGEINIKAAEPSGSIGYDEDVDVYSPTGTPAERLLEVPVTKLYPTDTPVRPHIVNPEAGDPQAVHRGKTYFNQFNCIGCHAPNGGGGMGRSLSNATFIYGSSPANIFLSIQQGRPAGMPVWGGVLPDHVIWDLVAYIKSISKEPTGQWGRTTSVEAFTIEQVPAEFMSTVNPWQHTIPFSYGQPPYETVKDYPPEAPGK